MKALLSKSRHAVGIFATTAGLLLASQAQAVQFTLSGNTADTWTYTLTYNPLDNYAITGVATQATLTLSGLSGVTGATGPSSTDFTPTGDLLDTVNKAWTAQVLNGGTEVVWTHIGPGTGNFDVDKHVFGFTVTAPGATTGVASFVTTGFSTDTSNGLIPRDITTQVAGPTAVPEPESLALILAGLVTVGGLARRARQQA